MVDQSSGLPGQSLAPRAEALLVPLSSLSPNSLSSGHTNLYTKAIPLGQILWAWLILVIDNKQDTTGDSNISSVSQFMSPILTCAPWPN